MTLAGIDDVIAVLPAGGLVGIVGAPGAGKSTIAAELVARIPRAALLPMDGFHLPQAELRRLGRRDRMGAPDTFDVDAFLAVLRKLRAGEAVIAPDFDREREEPVPGSLIVDSPLVIIEGNYLLLDSGGWEAARPLFDLTFCLEIDHDIRLDRLVARHVRFGKTPADARAWALGPDESNALLIETTAVRADYRIRL